MPGFKLEIFGDTIVDRNLMRFRQRSEDMRPVFTYIADDFLEIEREQFDSEGRRGSGGWRPLAASTIARKNRRGQDPRILHATLAMRNSLTRRGARGQIRTIRRDELKLGTRVSTGFVSTRASGRGPSVGFAYPAAHQHGTRHMPMRKPVELLEVDKRRWLKAIQEHLVAEIRSRA